MLVWSYKENVCHICQVIKQRKTWKILENTYSVAEFSEVYSKPSHTTKIGHFVEIVINSFEPLTIFAENTILDI